MRFASGIPERNYCVTGGTCVLVYVIDLREGDHLGNPGVDGRIILKLIFREWDWGNMH
jgi:hypothetical protein